MSKTATKEEQKAPQKRSYGWRPSLPDFRDYIYQVRHTGALPSKVDYRSQCPPIMDQGQLGSCTAHGITGAMRYNMIKQGEKDVPLSRLMCYYLERVAENSVDSDAGAMIRDGIKVMKIQGVCTEDIWPYDISKFTQKPPAAAYKADKKELSYHSVSHDLQVLKGALVDGEVIVIGFTVYESFESDDMAQSGDMPMPARHESVLGGHCVYVAGYDDSRQVFICNNSWAADWGDKGSFYMPYKYLTNSKLASDFWVIDSVN